ncbi:LysR substrate-binding domain-containing protein [Acidisphaera sp. L21]|uniref:LysR substrate-binding domain-containing protein n=1 Tax=Acidisphaera sp. L21 TaxID=1641851 RepID=UPI00131CAA67|nr:LysR substrate-binding domain-containing protein [Acidisphaera sp. L21]
MRRELPALNALRAFEAAARLGGFAIAAHELGVTAGAVSRHVKLLEERTGVMLFERRPRSLVLTPRGRDLLAVVGESFDRLDAGTRAVLRPAPRSRLKVNVQTSLAIGWMLARLGRFHRDRPELELELSTHIDTPDLRAGHIDAAILHGHGPWPGVVSHFLFGDRLQPVCSPRYSMERELRTAEPAMLLAETLIISHTARDDWTEWFSHAGLRGVRPQRTMTFGSSLLPAQAALHGLGVALVDLALIGDHLEAGRLLVLANLPPLVRGSGYYLAYAPGRHEDGMIQAFRQWLLAEVAATQKAM